MSGREPDRVTRRLLIALIAIPSLGLVGLVDVRDPRMMVDAAPAATPPATVERIDGPAAPDLSPARRLDTLDTTQITITAPTYVLPPPAPAGVWGLPFAPEGLDDCATASFYRRQFELPDIFDRLAWRESRCIADETVRTSCCVGRWQLYVRLHVRDEVLRLRYEACGVFTEWDVDGPEPIEQQRSACATRALWDRSGLDPWRTT